MRINPPDNFFVLVRLTPSLESPEAALGSPIRKPGSKVGAVWGKAPWLEEFAETIDFLFTHSLDLLASPDERARV